MSQVEVLEAKVKLLGTTVAILAEQLLETHKTLEVTCKTLNTLTDQFIGHVQMQSAKDASDEEYQQSRVEGY